MIEVKIIEKSFWARLAAKKLKSHSVAIVFGTTIHLWNVDKESFLANKAWLQHELEHVRQYRRYGFLPFLFLYFLEWVRHGYYQNKFEVAARNAERNEFNNEFTLLNVN